MKDVALNQIKEKLSGEVAVPHEKDTDLFQAGVFVPFIKINGEDHILFEKRAENIRQGGEISFPGGKVEKSDASFVETALRETCEELKTTPEKLEVFGPLRPHIIPTGIQVFPFVGCLKEDFEILQPEKDEVAYLFTVPLTYFLTVVPEIYASKDLIPLDKIQQKIPSVERAISEKRLSSPRKIYLYQYGKETIWGLTAEIIVTLLEKSGLKTF